MPHAKTYSYYISYGFINGRAHGKQLRQKLAAAGLRETKNAASADILIAHSAGCWRLPKTHSAQLIMLIGMPLQRGSTTRKFLEASKGNWQTFAANGHTTRELRVLFYSLIYMLRQPRRNITIAKTTQRRQQPVPDFAPARVVFVMNRHDPWPKSPELDELLESMPFAYVGLPDSHDNIWEHPERYVNIIKTHARNLLAQTS
jgi:hypothetical protein